MEIIILLSGVAPINFWGGFKTSGLVLQFFGLSNFLVKPETEDDTPKTLGSFLMIFEFIKYVTKIQNK